MNARIYIVEDNPEVARLLNTVLRDFVSASRTFASSTSACPTPTAWTSCRNSSAATTAAC
jgi:CheY-like chemotaxis protein